MGHPTKTFEDSYDSSKLQKTEHQRSVHSPDELSYAAQMRLYFGDNVYASYVVKEVTMGLPTRAGKYRNVYKTFDESSTVQLNGAESPAMHVDAELK